MTVQSLYTEEELLASLWQKRLVGMTLRAIAAEYEEISYGDIQRCLKGEFPKSPHKRAKLKLVTFAPAPICIKCGQVHVTKRCVNGNGKKGPRRVAVRVDDPESAARTIKRHFGEDELRKLIDELKF